MAVAVVVESVGFVATTGIGPFGSEPVYTPALVIEPPSAPSVTNQLYALLATPFTRAENVTALPGATVVGEGKTVIAGGEAGVWLNAKLKLAPDLSENCTAPADD